MLPSISRYTLRGLARTSTRTATAAMASLPVASPGLVAMASPVLLQTRSYRPPIPRIQTRPPALSHLLLQARRLNTSTEQGQKTLKTLKLSPHDSKASGFKDIKRLFLLAKPETNSMILALVFILISGAVSMTIPSVIGKLLDAAKEGHLAGVGASGEGADSSDSSDNQEDSSDRLIYGLTFPQFYTALGTIFVVGAFANMGRIVLLKVTGEKLVARLRTRTMKAALQQDATFLDNNRVGDLISRLSSDASIVSKSVTQNLSDGARAVIQGAVGFGMMSFISWKLTCVMTLMAPPLAIMAMVYGKKIRNLSRQLQTSVGGLTKVAEEQLSAARTVQAYGGEKQEIRRYAGEVRNVFNIGLKEALTSGVFFGVTGFVGNVALLALLLTGTSMIRSGAITVGDLSSFMMYAVYTGSSLFGLSSFYSELMKGAGAAARVFELNDRKPLIHPTKGVDPVTLQGKTIEFRNVAFAYPTRRENRIFDGLSLDIQPGEHVCIVGPSGGGKSTIASLLLRYYDVDGGRIAIGGQDIRQFNLRKYRRLLGVVQQEPLLFNGTILDNITYAVPGELAGDDSRVSRAIGQANCTKFLANFPDGLETLVGPRGAQMSGGQKQRIALARAFLLDPAVLILDEATSALDSQSEEVVAQSLRSRSRRGKTTVSIAHRLSTIQHSSRVIVLDRHGGVGETGSFRELISDPDSHLTQLLLKEEERVE